MILRIRSRSILPAQRLSKSLLASSRERWPTWPHSARGHPFLKTEEFAGTKFLMLRIGLHGIQLKLLHRLIFNKRMKHQILRLPEVIARTGLSRSTIYLHISQGNFPKSVSLGKRAVGWIEEEIQNWLQKKIDERQRESALGGE